MRKDFEKIIHYATLAPSTRNSQPWKFVVYDDKIQVIPDLDRHIPIADPDNHGLFISLGCALENLVIASRHFGFQATPVLQTEELLIDIEMRPTQRDKDNFLFEWIEMRQTTRNAYNGEPIPERHLGLLKAAASDDLVDCMILSIKQAFEPVIKLVREASIRQYSNKNFIEELVRWVRFNKMTADHTQDGLYAAANGQASMPAWLGKIMMEYGTSPEREAQKAEDMIRSSSALVAFVLRRNDPHGWISLGRSFERFSLTATSLSIVNAHLGRVCESEVTRKKLSKLLGLSEDQYPMILLRIGYSELMPYSLRRPVEEVTVAAKALEFA